MTEYKKSGHHPSVVWELWPGNSIQRICFLKHLAHAGIAQTREQGAGEGPALGEGQIPAKGPQDHFGAA